MLLKLQPYSTSIMGRDAVQLPVALLMLLMLVICAPDVHAQTGALTGIGGFCAGKPSQKVPAAYCNQYIQCSEDATTGVVTSCPEGQLYSINKGDCDLADAVWCPTGQRGFWGEMMPSGGVVSIHCALVPWTSWVIAWQRGMAWWVEKPEPGMAIPGSELLNTQGLQWEYLTALQDPLNNKYMAYAADPPFCSGQNILPNGQILACGGDYANMSGRQGEEQGIDECRTFKCWGAELTDCMWEPAKERMSAKRWYPTQLMFPPYNNNGHFTLIVGGSGVGQDPGEWFDIYQQVDVYYPFKEGKRMFQIEPTDFTKRLGNMNMYVFMFLLPVRYWYQHYIMFWFGVNYGEIVQVDDPATVKNPLKVLKKVPVLEAEGGKNVSVTYPAGSCAVFHHLEYPWTDKARVTIFGGQSGTFNSFDDYNTKLNAESLAVNNSWTIDLFNMTGGWEMDTMPDNALLRNCVLLPTGKVALVHGVRKGKMTAANTGDACTKEQLFHSWIFDVDQPAGKRYYEDASVEPTWRAYHGCAVLLPDGSIYSAGCETGEVPEGEKCTGPRDYHYNVDGYVPMYNYAAILDGTRPKIVDYPKRMSLNTTVQISYLGKVDECSLMTPGATTHLLNMSQRLAMMKTLRFIKLWKASDPETPGVIEVLLPPDQVVIMDGPTLLYCIWRRRVYSEGVWVQLDAPEAAPTTRAGPVATTKSNQG